MIAGQKPTPEIKLLSSLCTAEGYTMCLCGARQGFTARCQKIIWRQRFACWKDNAYVCVCMEAPGLSVITEPPGGDLKCRIGECKFVCGVFVSNWVHFVYPHNAGSSGEALPCVWQESWLFYVHLPKCMLLGMDAVVNFASLWYIYKADVIIQCFEYVFLACLLGPLYKYEWLFVHE